MTGALLFLIFTSLKNRLAVRIRRLRQPKYLVGAVVGGLYFYFYFFHYLFHPRRFGAQGGFSTGSEHLAVLETLGALILCGIVVLAWLVPHERGALTFTEAEVAFLFPAPVDRRTLIHYKLLKSQISVLFTTIILSLLFRRIGGAPGWVRAVGWWVILSTLNLHFIGSSFARTMLLEHGISTWKRRLGILAIISAAVIGVVIWAHKTIPLPNEQDIANMSDVEYYFQEASKAGPMLYLLFPFRLVIQPYISGYLGANMHAFFIALGPALLVVALHYWWVVRSNVAFEEASVEASKRMAERIASIRANRGQMMRKPKKGKRPPFNLRPEGLPAMGLFWKNLIGAGQMFTWRFWLIIVVVTVPTAATFASNPKTVELSIIVGTLALTFLPLSLFIGPQLVRQDFRHDLPMADVIKAYPLPGWQVALGELMAPAVILTALQWLLVTVAALLLSHFGPASFAFESRLEIALAVAVIVPALNVVTLIIPNAAVLLFPGWFQTGKDSPQGIEATGQRLIFAIGQLLVFIVVLLPAAGIFALVYFFARLVAEDAFFAIPIAAVPAAMILAAEAWLGVLWLGRLFNKFDLSAESGS
jgi:hypothetical protein